MTIFEFSNALSGGGLDELFSQIYHKSDMERLRQRARYLDAAENFSKNYPNREDIHVFSSSANVKIGGNYVAIQRGSELLAYVSADIIAIVGYHDDNVIRIKFDNSDVIEIDLSNLSDIVTNNSEITNIIKNIISHLAEKDSTCGGFDAYLSADIPEKCGFSFDETFNALISEIIDFSRKKSVSTLENAITGGISDFDMKNPHEPIIHKIDFDFSESGYSLCIVGNGVEFSLESEIESDMKSVANAMGIDYLGQTYDDEFYDKLPIIREKCTERAVFSAVHFFKGNQLVRMQRDALNNGRLNEFFAYISESADLSVLLPALYGTRNYGLLVVYYASKRFLNGCGAVRIEENGGIQAFVPNYMVNGFVNEIDRIFGQGSVQAMSIRNDSVIKIFG